MGILTAVGAIAAIVAAIASVKAVYPRPKPSIDDSRVSFTIHHPHTRRNSGFFLARNAGPRTYEITGLSIRCAEAEIELPDYNLVAVNQWPGEGVGKNGAQKLPLSIEGHTSKQIFFHTKEARNTYQGELPHNIIFEVSLNCRPKVITRTLSRKDSPHCYT